MLPKLYLYIDNYSFSDYYSANALVCESYMPNKKGSRTLGRNTQNFLFLTHKKLNSVSRNKGIEDQITNWPVVLELSFNSNQLEKCPVILVRDGTEGYSFEVADLSAYNPEVDLGCYVWGELPLSAVSKVLFNDECQMADSDKSIFPDFLWPANMIDVIIESEFTEELDLNIHDETLVTHLSKEGTPVETLLSTSKYRAAMLQLVNGTRSWVTGKYRASFDSVLIDCFSLETSAIHAHLTKLSMPNVDQLFGESVEKVCLIPTNLDEETASVEQRIYNAITSVFLTNNEKCTPAVIHALLDSIKSKIASVLDETAGATLAEHVDAIEACALNAVGYTVDNVINNITTTYGEDSVLKALFFAVKNASEFDKFILSLSLYKVDSITARRAMVLWGFLNGTRGIPARGYNRDNAMLWVTIEQRCAQLLDCGFRMKNDLATSNDFGGIEINSEEIITFEEVHAFLVANAELIMSKGKVFLKEIYTVAKNIDRKLSKADPYCGYLLTEENFYSKLPKLKSEEGKLISRAEFEAFDKAYTKKYKELITTIKKNALLDYDSIYKEFVVSTLNFKKIWDILEEKIKLFYVRARG